MLSLQCFGKFWVRGLHSVGGHRVHYGAARGGVRLGYMSFSPCIGVCLFRSCWFV